MRPSDLRPTITLREPAALITAALGVALLCVLLGPTPARVIGGFALVFVLPGLALTLAMLPMARVDPIAQLLLVVGVSVVVTIVTGLMVRSAYQLTTDAWAIALALVTIAGVVATALEDDSDVVPGPRDGPRTPRRFAFWALLVVAALLVWPPCWSASGGRARVAPPGSLSYGRCERLRTRPRRCSSESVATNGAQCAIASASRSEANWFARQRFASSQGRRGRRYRRLKIPATM